jgi:hypothetical protein
VWKSGIGAEQGVKGRAYQTYPVRYSGISTDAVVSKACVDQTEIRLKTFMLKEEEGAYENSEE